EEITHRLASPNAERVWYVRYAFREGMSVDEVFARTKIDRWFLNAILDLVRMEDELRECGSLDRATPELLLRAKQHGFSDPQLGTLWGCNPTDVRTARRRFGIEAVFKSVDTCAAEFEAYTPYYYSTYESGIRIQDSGFREDKAGGLAALNPESRLLNPGEDEVRPPTGKPRMMILGGGPNRIGQ